MWIFNEKTIDESEILDIIRAKRPYRAFVEELNAKNDPVKVGNRTYKYGDLLEKLDYPESRERYDMECLRFRELILSQCKPVDGYGFGIEYRPDPETDDEPDAETIEVAYFEPGMLTPRITRIGTGYNDLRNLVASLNPPMRCIGCVTAKIEGVEVDIWCDDEFAYHGADVSATLWDDPFILGGFVLAGHEGEETTSLPADIRDALPSLVKEWRDPRTGRLLNVLRFCYI